MEYRDYEIAGIRLRICDLRFPFRGLEPFGAVTPAEAGLTLRPGTCPPPDGTERLLDCFDFPDADAVCRLWRTAAGFRFAIAPREGSTATFFLPEGSGEAVTDLRPESPAAMFRFGLWMVFNLYALGTGVCAIHASVLLHEGQGVLCLGESGTGKSTHTRLWRQHIPGTELLNDDSPLLFMDKGRAMVSGSPWSGKTPCYRAEIYPVRGFVRLSQGAENSIERLRVIPAYGALLPSFPPAFCHDEGLSDSVNVLLSQLLRSVPVWRMSCLPDADAALLACKTIYGA